MPSKESNENNLIFILTLILFFHVTLVHKLYNSVTLKIKKIRNCEDLNY